MTRPHPAPEPTATGAPMQRLVAAQRTIAKDLSLPAMLVRIVHAACELAGARTGTLIVLGTDGGFDQVVRHGVDSSADGGPVLESTVTVRGTVFGHLQLTNPLDGCFDDAGDVLEALTVFAGAAIDNARHYEDAQRSSDWLHASGEIARALLADADADALIDVVSRALHVAEADYAALILPTGDGRLTLEVTVGLGSTDYRGMVFDPAESLFGQAILNGQSLLAPDMTAIADRDFINDLDYGPVMVAPLVDAHGVRGGVTLIRTIGRPAFSARDLDLATTFADQVALALQFNDARLDSRSLHALENRHAVSKELHDSVMQRLFATGMGLQGLADRDLPVHLAERLRRHICDLDETIDEIRARMFEAATGRAGDEADKFARMPHDARLAG